METNIREYTEAFVKSALISIKGTDGVAASDELFIETLGRYSSLRQIPKFFVKLLLCVTDVVKDNSNNKLFKRGQIIPPVLQSCAKCFSELPSGQTAELWEIFNETISALRKMCKESPSSCGAIFYVSQLFSTFLLHAKIFDGSVPDHIFSRIESLIEQTNQELKAMAGILKEGEEEIIPYRASQLMLCHAIGEVRLVCNITNVLTHLEIRDSEQQKQALDFSLLHPCLSDDVNLFSTYLKMKEDNVLNYFLIQLLIQKIRALKLKANLIYEEREDLQSSIAFLLQYITSLESSNINGSWNMDLCTLGINNCGTATWSSFLKSLPLIISSLSYKQISTICSSLINILLMEPEGISSPDNIDTKLLILSFLRSEFFQESSEFQTAVISSLWKYDILFSKSKKRSHDQSDTDFGVEKVLNELCMFRSKWAKFVSSTPKCNNNKDLNDLWLNVKETSTLINHFMESEALPKQSFKVPEMQCILKILNYLPLECLLPGNQMRCLMGLSVLFFSLPNSCSHLEMNELAESIAKLLIAVFEGVRSIWLFDFVDSSLYLKAVVKTLDGLKMKAFAKTSDWAKNLLEHVVSLSTRNAQFLDSMEGYLNKLANDMLESVSSALVTYTVLHRLSLHLQRRYLQSNYKDVCERIVSMIGSSVVRCIKNKPDENMNSDAHTLLINCYTEIIGLLVNPVCQLDEKKHHKWLKVLPTALEMVSLRLVQKHEVGAEDESYLQFLCKLCLHHKELSFCLPSNFVQLTWKAISTHLKKKCEVLSAQDSAEHLAVTKSEQLKKTFQSTNHLCPNYPSIHISKSVNLLTLNNSEIDVLHSISKSASEVEIKDIFESFHAEIAEFGVDIGDIDPVSFQMRLLIVRHLIDSLTEKSQLSNISSSIQKFLLCLHFITTQTCESPTCLLTITVPVLQFVCFILKKDKGVLPKQTLLQCLHFCSTVRIEKLHHDPVLFVRVFDAMWNVLNDLITHHHDLLISSNAAYLSFLSVLLKSVVQAGNQEILMKQSDYIKQQLEMCAQNMDRLLTLTSKDKLEFGKLVPYLIADYVDSVQHITCHPSVKEHILLGINRLLDICSQDSLQMLAVNINHSCREIYSNLVRNYKHYRQYV